MNRDAAAGADGLMRMTLFGAVRRFLNDWKKYRDYVLYASWAELRAEVSRAYLDWIWWVLEPLCMMLVYGFIFGVVFQAREPYFAVFIFIGLTLWRFFSMTVRGSATLIRNHKTIVVHAYVPKTMLLLVMMFKNSFKTLLSMLIVAVMMLVYRVPPTSKMLLLIPAVLLLFLITFWVSCFVMHWGVFIEDLAYASNVLLTMMMYFTGTFWSIENRLPAPYGLWISRINPIALCISLARNGLLYGFSSFHWAYLVWLAVSLVLTAVGLRLVYQNENTYAKVI